MNAFAKLVERRLFAPSVLKTVQVNLYALLLQRRQLIKQIENPAVVGRVGYVEANDMKMFVQYGLRYSIAANVTTRTKPICLIFVAGYCSFFFSRSLNTF